MAEPFNWWTWIAESGTDPATAEAPKDWWQQALSSPYPCYAERDWGERGGDANVMNTAAVNEKWTSWSSAYAAEQQ